MSHGGSGTGGEQYQLHDGGEEQAGSDQNMRERDQFFYGVEFALGEGELGVIRGSQRSGLFRSNMELLMLTCT